MASIAVEPIIAAEADAAPPSAARPTGPGRCFHCGEPCVGTRFAREDKRFCCQGCLTVHELLKESGLGQFYELSQHPGVRVRGKAGREKWAFLDDPVLQRELLDFSDGGVNRVTFQIPSMHCVACVWLLENLFRLHPGIGESRVNFPRREVSVTYIPGRIALGELAALLSSIGYEPRLSLEALGKAAAPASTHRKQWLQVGVAGFAFGNIMLLSVPAYLGLDSFSGPVFRTLFGWLNLALALPVLIYSASDYWKSAWLAVRQRIVTLDVPIALGLAALYGQSAFEILTGRGEGYLDSLSGLVFFLLCGRVFQQKTHERIAFDRDYRSFFPLSVTRQAAAGEAVVPISQLEVGDILILRQGEIIPADATLVRGAGQIDYSFVTGESRPVSREPGDHLYAGGRQIGATIEIQIVKPVSQSYLASLWAHEAFRKHRSESLDTLTNRYSRRFTWLVIAIALAAAGYWLTEGNPARGIKAFASVLIVACPCALALAAPFTFGTAQRLLARAQVFLKNALVLERLARVRTIVFDKTGTLTTPRSEAVSFHPLADEDSVPPDRSARAADPTPAAENLAGSPSGLTAGQQAMVWRLCRQSTHPVSVQIAESLAPAPAAAPVRDYREIPGAGLCGTIGNHRVHLGSRQWLEGLGMPVPPLPAAAGTPAILAIDGRVLGAFLVRGILRPDTQRLIRDLSQRHDLALLSGDSERERAQFEQLFGRAGHLRFHQSPLDKLGFIRRLQDGGQVVMMVGDGLNDAGALKQSDVGVAVVERIGAFSPASDVILPGSRVPHLGAILRLARQATRIVRLSFGISALYNAVGISIAAAGILSPLICAVLMPVSSVSVVLFACGMTAWAARRSGLPQLERGPQNQDESCP